MMGRVSHVRFLKRGQQGSSLVPYGLLIGLIGILAIGVISSTGDSVRNLFEISGDTMSGAADGSGSGGASGGGASGTDPTISSIADQSTGGGGSVGPLAFTVTDPDGPAASLVVTAVSSNQSAVADGNIVLGGSGENRTISFTASSLGATVITITVSDGSNEAQTNFNVSVSPPGGVAFSWGPAASGRLGNNTISGVETSPVRVTDNLGDPLSTTWTAIAAGTVFSCAIEAGTGYIWCWGGASDGHLGNNDDTTDQLSPVRLRDAGDAVVNTSFTFVSSRHHSCAIESGTGYLWCWGSNQNGKLGNNDASGTDSLNPVRVRNSSNALITHGWTDVSAGTQHTCAVDAVNNYAWCWGIANGGRLGNNDTSNTIFPYPVRVKESGGADSTRAWSNVETGQYHSCGIEDSTGHIWCWGFGGNGQVGDNATSTRSTIVQLRDSGNSVITTSWSDLSLGSRHSCAIESGTGHAWCWGQGINGQLGNNDTAQHDNPVRVTDNLGDPLGTSFSAISAAQGDSGSDHNCALVSGTGAAWCWGVNSNGQLGDGTTDTPRLSPVAVSGGVFWSAIDTGGVHSAGIVD